MNSENIKKGIFYLLIASFLFSSMQAAGKALYYISSFERTFYFSLVAAIIFFIICRKRKESLLGERPGLLTMRAAFGFLSTIFLFMAATQDYPIANVSLLSSTSTIFALIAACIWLKESMNKGQVLALVVAFIGVMLILKPSLTVIDWPSLYGLLAGFFAGIAYTIIRKLKDYASPYTLTFFFMAFSAAASFPFVLYQGMSPLHLKEIVLLSFMGICMSLAQLFISFAYRYASSTKISVYLYSQNLFAFLIGIFIFKEIPDTLSILGGCTLIGAGVLNFITGKRKEELVYETEDEARISNY